MVKINDLTKIFYYNKYFKNKEIFLSILFLISIVRNFINENYSKIIYVAIIIIVLAFFYFYNFKYFYILNDILIIGYELFSTFKLLKSSIVIDNLLEIDCNKSEQHYHMFMFSLTMFIIYIFVPFLLNFRYSMIIRNIHYVLISIIFTKYTQDRPQNIFSNLVAIIITLLNLSFIILNTVIVIVDIKYQDEYELKEKYENSMMKVIHDLQNPFHSINEMIKDKESSIDKVLNNISSESNDGLNMLENLKMYFRMSHGMEINENSQNVDIYDYIENLRFTHTKLAIINNDKLILKHPEQIPINIKIHSVLVNRIMNNFISNAIKHTMGGIISISYKIVNDIIYESSFIIIKKSNLNIKGKYIRFEVKDNGMGICEENIHKIFENKVSDQSGSNWDGTGLGLPICSNISSKINSEIHYKSTVGQGSVFVFYYYIPLDNDQDIKFKQFKVTEDLLILKTESWYNKENSSHNCKEILVAEDNLGILKAYKRYFDKHNIVYKLFTNGLSCYNYICKNKCDHCNSILFTDNQMPQKSGIELAIELRKLNLNMKIIMISADDVFDSNNLFDAIYHKPMVSKEFLKYYNENLTRNCIKIYK